MTRLPLLFALALSGCGYFLPTGAGEPDYCYRTGTGSSGAEMWTCTGEAEYPRDTLPDVLKARPLAECVTDSECEGLIPVPYRPEVSR